MKILLWVFLLLPLTALAQDAYFDQRRIDLDRQIQAQQDRRNDMIRDSYREQAEQMRHQEQMQLLRDQSFRQSQQDRGAYDYSNPYDY